MEMQKEGKLIAAGAFNPPTGAMFLFSAEGGKSAADNFVKQDPYVSAGLVTNHSIKEWTVAVGDL